jgi:hypothetical protein
MNSIHNDVGGYISIDVSNEVGFVVKDVAVTSNKMINKMMKTMKRMNKMMKLGRDVVG